MTQLPRPTGEGVAQPFTSPLGGVRDYGSRPLVWEPLRDACYRQSLSIPWAPLADGAGIGHGSQDPISYGGYNIGIL